MTGIEQRAHLMQVRTFEVEQDYEMLVDWFQWHQRHDPESDRVAPPKELLPPIGIVVYLDDGFHREDIAALFLYTAVGVAVCFVECVITKPELRPSTSIRALMEAQKYLRTMAGGLGYRLMFAHTLKPIARYLKREGWVEGDSDMVSLYAVLTE